MVSESSPTGAGTWQCQWTGLLHHVFCLSSWRRYFERWPRPPHLPHTLQWACVLHVEALITALTLPGTPQPLQGGQGLPLCRSALQMWQHKESRVPRCRMPRCPESSPSSTFAAFSRPAPAPAPEVCTVLGCLPSSECHLLCSHSWPAPSSCLQALETHSAFPQLLIFPSCPWGGSTIRMDRVGAHRLSLWEIKPRRKWFFH